LISRGEDLSGMAAIGTGLIPQSVPNAAELGQVRKSMKSQMAVTTGRVTTEGDELYYEYWGQGQPLLMIPAEWGDAGIFTFVADVLGDEFKVITQYCPIIS
jgi:hypothetical protein